LHPEDAAIVRERLSAPSSDRAWSIVEDPTMSRGGCVVRTENSHIDARLESRISTIIANAFGDERAADRATGAETQSASPSEQPAQPTGPTTIGTPVAEL
jgi:flagellar assembly protein FliH